MDYKDVGPAFQDIRDVLQEIVNNNDLPEGCETGIRSFYVHSYIAFILTNNPETLAQVVRERTEQYIREYNACIPLQKTTASDT